MFDIMITLNLISLILTLFIIYLYSYNMYMHLLMNSISLLTYLQYYIILAPDIIIYYLSCY